MSNINIDFKNRELKLVKWQYLNHYYIVLLPILLYIIIASVAFQFNIYILVPLCLSILFFLIQKRILKFKEFKINCSHENLTSAMARSAKSLDWKVESADQILFAFDKENLDFRYNSGYLIVVTKTKSGFLFNSLSDPRNTVVPIIKPYFTLNIEVFKKHLIDVIKGTEYNEDFPSLANEWSVRKILSRLFLYPISIGILLFLFYSLNSNESISAKGFISLIITSIISIIYLFYDIKGLLKKTKHNQVNESN